MCNDRQKLVGIDSQQKRSVHSGIREVCTNASIEESENGVVSDVCMCI